MVGSKGLDFRDRPMSETYLWESGLGYLGKIKSNISDQLLQEENIDVREGGKHSMLAALTSN